MANMNVYHSNQIETKDGSNYIFYKYFQFDKDMNELKKLMDYTSAERFDYCYYDKDKTPLPDNDFEHYFIDKDKPEVEKVSKSQIYKGGSKVDKNRVYNYFSPEKHFRLSKIKERPAKTFLFRNISILYFDIELYAEQEVDIFDSKLSVFDRYINPINAISIVSQNNKTGQLDKKLFLWDKFNRTKFETDKYELVYFDSEKDLLNGLVHYLVEQNFDIYTGWNIHFDLAYVYTRLYKVLGKLYCNALSPFFKLFVGGEQPKFGLDLDTIKLASLFESDEEKIVNGVVIGQEKKTKVSISGINVIDYMETMRKKDAVKSEVKDGYGLDFAVQIELGMSKVDYAEYGDLNTLYEEDLVKFCDYNFEDSWLVYKLEEKLGYIKTLCIISSIALIQNVERSQSSNALWEDSISMYSNIVRNKYEIHISKKGREEIKESFPAALDMDVSELNNNVFSHLLTYDWASLYPTTVMSIGISPEKKKAIRKGKYKSLKDLIYYLYDFNETIDSLTNIDKTKKRIENTIKDYQEEKESTKAEAKKEKLSREIAFEKKKLAFLDSDAIKNIPVELCKEIEDNFKPHEKYFRGLEEIDKVLIYSNNKDIGNYAYGITAFFKHTDEEDIGIVPFIMLENFLLRIGYKKMGSAMEDLLKKGIKLKEFEEIVKKHGLEKSDEYKEFMKYYEATDYSMCKVINNFVKDLENALKIYLNSGFGVFGNKYFKWYDKDFATSITMSARKILCELIIDNSQFINGILKTPDKRRIIYGATDSIFVTFDDLFTPEENISLTNDAIVKRVFSFLEEHNVENRIKTFVERIGNDFFGTLKNYWDLEMEKYSREAIFFSQKNYILKLIYKGKSFVKDDQFGYKYIIKGIKIKKVDTPSYLRSKDKQAEILEMIFKSRKVSNYELLRLNDYIFDLYDGYVNEGKKNLSVLGGSVNVKSEMIKKCLDASLTEVVKEKTSAHYSGLAVYNNFMARLKQDGINTDNYIFRNSGFNEKAVTVFAKFDGDYIRENSKIERKTKTKKKELTLTLPRKFKFTEEIFNEIFKRIDFQTSFEKKVLTNVLNYVRVPEDVDIQKILRQRNGLKVK